MNLYLKLLRSDICHLHLYDCSTIRKWNIHSGQCLREIYGHEAFVYRWDMTNYCMCLHIQSLWCLCVPSWFLIVVFPCSLMVDQMTLPPVERMGLWGCGKACIMLWYNLYKGVCTCVQIRILDQRMRSLSIFRPWWLSDQTITLLNSWGLIRCRWCKPQK